MNAPPIIRVLLGLLSFSTLLPAAAPQAAPVNVLFLAADDLRVEVGCYGGTPALTPHLDRLAARGMRFRHAYCQQALCNPSRASLLTGLRPDTLRLWNLTNHFCDTHPDIVALPQLFLQRGWHTQNIGKVFHNWQTENWETGRIVATELYDHQNDPAETRNISAANPETVSRLGKELGERYVLHCRPGGPTSGASP